MYLYSVRGHLTARVHFSKQSTRVHMAWALFDFRLLSTEQKTPQPLFFNFFNFFKYIFFIVLHARSSEEPEVSPWSSAAVILFYLVPLPVF